MRSVVQTIHATLESPLPIILLCPQFVLFSSIPFGQSELRDVCNLNAEFIEYGPSFSAGGSTMVYQSNQNRKHELHESKISNHAWGIGELLKGKINSFGDSTDLIGGPSLSYDGEFIYFYAFVAERDSPQNIYYFKGNESTCQSILERRSPLKNMKDLRAFF